MVSVVDPNLLPPPPTRERITDGNGVLSPVWFIWFTQFWKRAGGAIAPLPEDFEVLSSYSDIPQSNNIDVQSQLLEQSFGGTSYGDFYSKLNSVETLLLAQNERAPVSLDAVTTELAATSRSAPTSLDSLSTEFAMLTPPSIRQTNGTFTATLTCSTSGTITLDAAKNTMTWVKTGNLVFICGLLVVSSVSSPVGRLILGGLPYPIPSPDRNYAAFSVEAGTLLATATTSIVAAGLTGTSTIAIDKYAAGVTSDMAGDVQATSGFILSGTYCLS